MHDLTHITLTTGHSMRSPRSDVSDRAVERIVPWLEATLGLGYTALIPGLEETGCQARIMAAGLGGLLVTVYSPNSEVDIARAMVSFGVATHPEHAQTLWNLLSASPGVVAGLSQPPLPWCAVVRYPMLQHYGDAMEWLGDFERCCAWGWSSRRPTL